MQNKKVHQMRILKPNVPKSASLPQAIDLEESTLGALILERDALPEVMGILRPSHFARDQHRLIYEAILRLFNANEAIDAFTVINQLRKDGTLKRAGGPAYLLSLMDSIASNAHIATHVRILIQYAIKRSLVSVGCELIKEAQDDTSDAFALLDRAEQALFDVSETNTRKNYERIDSILYRTFKNMENRRAQKGIVGVPTGFSYLDRLILGLKRSNFVIIAARPGMGKTSLQLCMAINIAVHHKSTVAFFSLEMSSEELGDRMLAIESGLPGEDIQKGTMTEKETKQLFEQTAVLAQAPIYIDDTPALSLFEFRAKCRRLKVKKNIRVAFVDYLQLMTDTTASKGSNIEQQISNISRGLKAIAKELDITVVAASQLSRSVETRGGDKRPQLSDLRYSGAIEQDADLVCFLYRPEYYGIDLDDKCDNTEGLAEVIVAKNRNGRTGRVQLSFRADSTKFGDYSIGDSNSGQNEPFNV